MIDNFSLEPLPCQSEEPEPASIIIPPICSRYRENFWGIAEMAWRTKDPEPFDFGPGIWKFQK